MDNLLLTPEQAVELLHIGRTTLYGLLRDGALRAVHIGRLCRVPHTELVRYVETLAAGVTASEPAHPATPTPMVGHRRDRRSSTPAQAELFGPQRASHTQAG